MELGSFSHRFSRAEQRHTALDADRTVDEMCFEAGLEIVPAIGDIAEKSARVVRLHQFRGQEVLLGALTENRCAEDYTAIPQQRFDVLKHNALALQIAGEAVQQIVKADRSKVRHADIDGLEHISRMAGGSVAAQAFRRGRETVGVQIKQREGGSARRKAAPIKEVARSHADIQMPFGNMLVVEIEDPLP